MTKVLRALGAGSVDVRIVGGAVRNAVMGVAVTEVDLATPELPARVTERLLAAGLKAVPTGIDHGTVMAVVGGETFEITTLRRDTACDGRHAAVEFTTDWHEDARRRDFTFNAMSLSISARADSERVDSGRADGAVFDDHGGWDDAKAGRVRFVGEAADRIQEDYLRILRLFRFFAWYGRAPLDQETLRACATHADGLAQLSAERVQQEVSKMLAAPQPLKALEAMAGCGVLARVLPEVLDLAPLMHLEAADGLLRLAALLPDDTAAAAVALRLKLSNAERDRLSALTTAEPALDDHTGPQALRRALYHLGAPLVRDRILLARARALAAVKGGAPDADAADSDSADSKVWQALLSVVQAWEPKTLPVGGADVLGLGVAAGPAVGRLLTTVEEWWIGAGFTPGRSEALEYLKTLINK